MKLALMFYPNVSKASKKTGKVPLYVRVTLFRQKAECRLNIEIPRSDVMKWDGNSMRFIDRNMTENVLLNTIDNNFNDFKHHNSTRLHAYNVKTILNKIIGRENNPNPKILFYVDKYYNSSIAPNEQMAAGTKRNYRKALNHLRFFLQCNKMNRAELSAINTKFAYDFKDYLLATDVKSKRVGMKESSALGIVKKLRSIFERAVEEELMSDNPFKKIKLANRSPIRARLDIHQVRLIYELNLRDFPTQQIYRDMFMFSIFTGLAYADASNLKKNDLFKSAGGAIRLYLKRAKTEIITEMILPKQASEILIKYKDYPELQITKAVLPRRSNKEVNVQLKILANMVNIPIKLSTHIARHTFRQLLAEADITEMGVIKRIMGHSSSREIDGIYYQVTESRLLEAKRKFELYLEKSFNEVPTGIPSGY